MAAILGVYYTFRNKAFFGEYPGNQLHPQNILMECQGKSVLSQGTVKQLFDDPDDI